MIKSYRNNKVEIILLALCVAMLIVLQAVAKEPDSALPAPSVTTPSVTTQSAPIKPAPTQQAASKKAGPKQAASKEPVHITSDTLEAFNDERLIVFSGNAVAVQGDKVIRSNKLLVYYKKGADEGKDSAASNIGQGGDLDRIEAKGPVRITQLKKIVTGDEAVYYQDDQKIVVFGNAVMREGPNIVKGDRITVLLDENRGIVEAPEKKRVSATIYPAEDGKKKK
ncbi:MAG: lipopolysaccharide export system protein LptA [Thermodesulfobacteriota bacterium]|nr:lipopolysaccharide export system protein LptA [Thermodesulfobacteriota bacterium]